MLGKNFNSLFFNAKSRIFTNSEDNNKSQIYQKDYEKKLYKEYGTCNSLNKKIKLLIIADTHGALNEEDFINFLNNKTYDMCIMLGDHYDRDIGIIMRHIDKSKLYGLLGNHDYDYLSNYSIPNLNGKIIQVNGVSFLGMQGSFKYKTVNFPSFTEEESIEFFKDKPSVDILLTHDKKFDPEKMNKDPAHQGLIGITYYIYKNKVPIHIHGHIHENYEKIMLNGTKEISVFGYGIIEVGNENSK